MKWNHKYIIIAASVLVALIILCIIFYRKGKKQVTLQSLPGELPGVTDSGNTNGASNDEIKRIASALYADMHGVNAFGHNYDPYQQAIQLNDTDIVKLYDVFNSTYQTESEQTLTAWVESEYYSLFLTPTVEAFISKLKKLNCL